MSNKLDISFFTEPKLRGIKEQAMSEHDTESSLFRVRTHNSKGSPYEERAINMAFENQHMPLFKIVPPAVGSFIYLEAKFRIEQIAYHKGKIILCLILEF